MATKGSYPYPGSSEDYTPYGTAQVPSKVLGLSTGVKDQFGTLCATCLTPAAVFGVVSAATMFPFRYYEPGWTWLLVVLCAMTVLHHGVLVAILLQARCSQGPSTLLLSWYLRTFSTQKRSSAWYVLIFVTLAAAFAFGLMYGLTIYPRLSFPRGEVEQLMSYSDVDPRTWSGEQLLDAGTVTFIPGTRLDISRSMGFHYVDMYCVAPVVAGNTTPGSIDIWAVGLNCCPGNAGGFACGASKSPSARSGLRQVNTNQNFYYSLAVQQAEATFGIKAEHPTFFSWTEDVQKDLDEMQQETVKCYFIGLFAFLSMQFFVVIIAWVVFSAIAI